MGLCFSKKKKPPPGGPGSTSKKVAAAVADDKAKKTAPQQPKSAAKVDKNAVTAKAAATAAAGEDKKKKRAPQEDSPKQLPVVVVPSAPVRTSSCTREEVDAILIQCGRLSRSSSGTGRAASGETGGGGGESGHRRRRSGSKRSYDFDQERKTAAGGDEECDWERQGVPVSRPSPQRKRSGSRERSAGGSGSRRASRSPGRRGEGGVSSAAMASSGGGERARQQQQPGKMVSVPAREKGRAPSPAAASGIRCASPRSSSPARVALGNENASGVPAVGPTPALSRSSSRKAEQSPYRRNPMAELDENTLRSNSNNTAKPQKKFSENTVAATHQRATERVKEPAGTASCRSAKEKPEIAEDATIAASDTRAVSAKTDGTRTASGAAESLGQRPSGCRSRRASRDFDQSSNSYASQILEDIQSYHEQQHPATSAASPSFTLPACVAKACSILEAVADLNSSSSDNRTYDYEPGRSADDKGSVNALSGTDSRVEPSARRLGKPAVRDVRADAEPQESAGSNSVSGFPWTPSWEPTSAESTDRTWSTGDEVVEQAGSRFAPSPVNRPRQSKQRQSQQEPGGRSRAGSGNGSSSLRRGRSAHRGGGSVASGRSGVRTISAAS